MLEGCSFGYASVPVLTGVDLEVAPGDFVGIVGPNGAGKTTLLRGLLGLLPPSAGRVRRDGIEFGYVPQRDSLDSVFPVSVGEVVEMGCYGADAKPTGGRRALSEHVRASLELVRLEDRAGARFSSLSGGQRQRVLLARALVSRPNFLVLDEPTSGVDQPTLELLLEVLLRLNREEGLAIWLVSHQLELLRSVQRVAWVADGSVVLGAADSPEVRARVGALFGALVTEGAAWKG